MRKAVMRREEAAGGGGENCCEVGEKSCSGVIVKRRKKLERKLLRRRVLKGKAVVRRLVRARRAAQLRAEVVMGRMTSRLSLGSQIRIRKALIRKRTTVTVPKSHLPCLEVVRIDVAAMQAPVTVRAGAGEDQGSPVQRAVHVDHREDPREQAHAVKLIKSIGSKFDVKQAKRLRQTNDYLLTMFEMLTQNMFPFVRYLNESESEPCPEEKYTTQSKTLTCDLYVQT